MKKKVIVVGAGMAGLAAAQVLHRRGLDVSVLECESRVGGRVHIQAFHGRTIECGAQFPSTGYRHIPALLAEAGLSSVPCSPWAAFEREGCWHRVHRWPLAEPLSPPGRARAVQHYRDTLPPRRRALLCGDSTGLSWTEGAIETGLRAAARLVEELS